MLKPSYFTSSADKASAKVIISIVASLMLAGASEPGPPPPEVSVNEVAPPPAGSSHQIGDRLVFSIDLAALKLDPGETMSLRFADEPREPTFYLDPSPMNQGLTLRFIASPLKAGETALPSLNVIAGENRIVAKTRPLPIRVSELQSAKSDAPDLIDVIPLKLPLRYLIAAILLGLLALGLAYALYRRLRSRRKPKPEVLPTVVIEPDHLVALKKLEELFQPRPFTLEHLKSVSFGCSEILKEFFERRFKIDALESTTDEMIVLLRREALEPDELRDIRLLFEDLDRFKFLNIESYPKVEAEILGALKIRAQLLVQKWAFMPPPGGP